MGRRGSGKGRGLRGRLARRVGWGLLLLVAATLLPVLLLRWIPPPTSAFMLQTRLAPRLRGEPSTPVHYRWIPWHDIAPAMRLAVVAAEDQKFPHHRGFDLESIGDALERPTRRGRIRGASTITQQVARNLFLWPGRSYLRKGLEAYFTLLLEACWPKRRILEVYLNLAEFEAGVHGVAEASRRAFGVRASDLSTGEAARLAAVLPNPRRLSARLPSDYVQERAGWIEAQMAQLGGSGYLRDL